MKQPRQIDGAVRLEHLPIAQAKVRPQPLHDLPVGARFDLQPHRRALPPPVELRVHGIQDASRLLLPEIKVAVARHPKGRARENLIAVEDPVRERVHDVVQERVLELALGRRQAQ